MEINAALRFYLLFLLFWGIFFFTISEAALFSLGRLRLQKLKEENHPRHPMIERLLSRPRRLIITLLMGNEIFNVAISSLTSALFIGLWGDSAKWAAIPLVVFVILLFGELIPKTLAVRFPGKIAPFVAPGVERFSKSVEPLVGIIIKIVDSLLGLARVRSEPLPPPLTEEEFKSLVETGQKEGTLEEAEKYLIHKVFEFGDKAARNIMTPRSAVFALPLSTKLRDAVEALRIHRFSRVPVYRKNLEEIVGILYVKDLLGVMSQPMRGEEMVGLRPFLRKPYFVPLSKKLDDLFRELQKQRIHLAIVVDEYGSMAGVVTLEDLLEELFGEIRDELDLVRFAKKRGEEKGKLSLSENHL
ncbi:MAG: HlyC/CorC family transporter [Deltaproteobacteria bacterium]|nr:HlyC/CorC family transporter [Deltaproteobacteria bacterium]